MRKQGQQAAIRQEKAAVIYYYIVTIASCIIIVNCHAAVDRVDNLQSYSLHYTMISMLLHARQEGKGNENPD